MQQASQFRADGDTMSFSMRRQLCAILILAVCYGCEGRDAKVGSTAGTRDSAGGAIPLRDSSNISDSPSSSARARRELSEAELAGTITRAAVIYVEASDEELNRFRQPSGDSTDAQVSADDLMFYRSSATQYLQQQKVPFTRISGRRTLTFRVDGEPREYTFSEVELSDFIIVYDGRSAPKILAPNDLGSVPDGGGGGDGGGAGE